MFETSILLFKRVELWLLGLLEVLCVIMEGWCRQWYAVRVILTTTMMQSWTYTDTHISPSANLNNPKSTVETPTEGPQHACIYNLLNMQNRLSIGLFWESLFSSMSANVLTWGFLGPKMGRTSLTCNRSSQQESKPLSNKSTPKISINMSTQTTLGD